MKLHFILLIAFLGITLVACNKDNETAPPDPCEDVQCRNGGVCIDGTCDCPDNTEGVSCETKTPLALQIENIYCTFEHNQYHHCYVNDVAFDIRFLYGIDEVSPVLYNTGLVNRDMQQLGAIFNISSNFELKDLDRAYGTMLRRICGQTNYPTRPPEVIYLESFTPMEHYEKDNASLAVIELGSSSLGVPITIEGTWIYE